LSIEAKQGWCRIDENENKLIQSIEEHLCAAKGSASNLIEDGSKKISAAFISPLWKQTDKADFETARKVWMQKCSKAASAVAMIVPDRDESPRDQRNDFCVGSSLLLDIV
jgi:hypothetical protein